MTKKTEPPEDNVVQFVPEIVGENYRFDCDEVLEAAKGQDFHRMCIIGQYENGEIYFAGNANFGETLILMELAKKDVLG